MNTQEAKHFLTGSVMSLRPPFDGEGNIDYDGVAKVIDVSLAGGSRTIMLTAGDSHYLCLSDSEIEELTKFTCEYTAKRGMVIVADRFFSTKHAIEFAEYCKKLGADMYMALPSDTEPACTSRTLAEHYAAIAQIMPVMIVTGRFSVSGKKFGLEVIEQSLDLSKNVVAIKDDMCGEFAQDICMQFGERVAIIAGGQKRNHMLMWPYGADGYLSTFVTFNPEFSQKYWNAITANDIKTAIKLIEEQDRTFFEYIISLKGGFDAAMHGMLELYGLGGRHRRKPYYTLNDEEMENLHNFLKSIRLI